MDSPKYARWAFLLDLSLHPSAFNCNLVIFLVTMIQPLIVMNETTAINIMDFLAVIKHLKTEVSIVMTSFDIESSFTNVRFLKQPKLSPDTQSGESLT